jgi:excisionase family DNA binding protein
MSTNIRIQKVCQYCNSPFTAKTLVTRYCSKTCNERDYKRIAREKKIEVHVSQTVNSNLSSANVPANNNAPDDCLEISEAAKVMRISRRTLYRLIALRKIKAKKLMTRTVILRKDIYMYFDQQW